MKKCISGNMLDFFYLMTFIALLGLFFENFPEIF